MTSKDINAESRLFVNCLNHWSTEEVCSQVFD